MSSINKVMLIGRLGQDPEVRTTDNGTKVATLSLATSERYKDRNGEYQEKTEWHRIVAWARKAEIVEQYTSKGSQLYVEGSLQTQKWQDKEGKDRYTTQIKAFIITMLDGKNKEGQGAGPGASKPAAKKQIDSSMDMDDDLPF